MGGPSCVVPHGPKVAATFPGLLSGWKKWESRWAVSALLIKKVKASPIAACRRLSLTCHGPALDHRATPSSKSVWGSHCSSFPACVIVEVGQVGNGCWSFHKQDCLLHSPKENGDRQVLDSKDLAPEPGYGTRETVCPVSECCDMRLCWALGSCDGKTQFLPPRPPV